MKYYITLAFALISYFAHAQEKLTLSKAINFALENKKEAVKAQLDYQNSYNKIDEVRSAALPQISAHGTLTYNPIIQQVAMPNFFKDLSAILNPGGGTPLPDFGTGDFILMEMGTKWQTNATVSLTQQIFNQQVFTGLKAAKTTKEFYAINQQLTNEQIIEKVATAYYEVYQTKQKLVTINTNLDNTTKTRDVIDGLFKNGLAKKIDLDRTSVAVNNLKASKQQVTNALQLQENALKFMIGMDIYTSIYMPEDSFDVTEVAFVDENQQVENRTEIKVIDKQLELLELNMKAKRAEYYPTLSLTANYGYLGQGEKFPWFKKPADQVFYSDMSAVSLNLNIPIFNGFATRSRVRQAQIDIMKAEADRKDLELAMNLDLQNAKTQINNSLITINTQKENVNLAKEVLNNIENNYKNGLASLTDLLDAEKAYADAQNNYTNALLEYKLAEVKLIKSKGELETLTIEK